MTWLVMLMALVGKFAISGAYQIIYLYSSELFPTEVRLQGIGVASLFAQMASTVLPYITSILVSFRIHVQPRNMVLYKANLIFSRKRN